MECPFLSSIYHDNSAMAPYHRSGCLRLHKPCPAEVRPGLGHAVYCIPRKHRRIAHVMMGKMMEMMIHERIWGNLSAYSTCLAADSTTCMFQCQIGGIAAITVNPPGTAPAQACDDAWIWDPWGVKMFGHFRQGDFKP